MSSDKNPGWVVGFLADGRLQVERRDGGAVFFDSESEATAFAKNLASRWSGTTVLILRSWKTVKGKTIEYEEQKFHE